MEQVILTDAYLKKIIPNSEQSIVIQGNNCSVFLGTSKPGLLDPGIYLKNNWPISVDTNKYSEIWVRGTGAVSVAGANVVDYTKTLFDNGEFGFWLDPVDGAVNFKDTAGTIPAVEGDPVLKIEDKSGNGLEGGQNNINDAPTRVKVNGNWAHRFTDNNDGSWLVGTIPSGGLTGELYIATSVGKGRFGIQYSAGDVDVGAADARWILDLFGHIVIDRQFTTDELAALDAKYSMAGNFNTDLIDGRDLFRQKPYTYIDPNITFDALENASGMFISSGFTDMPAGMTLPNLTNGQAMYGTSSIENLPADFASECDCLSWGFAFIGTNLTQQSIDNFLINIDARGTFNGSASSLQSGGSPPSAAGEAAIDNLRARGWIVDVTGGY